MSMSFFPVDNRWVSGFASQFEVSTHRQRSARWELLSVLVIFVVGAVIRLWGLDGWGLEGDEDTMALPAVHILKDGMPLLPSGMFYGRGIAQLYLMAGSMRIFGISAWAMRLPSVLCGLGLILLAFWYGRRFLLPTWNVAFVAGVAFLPGIIADSQEARMYIFFLAALAGYTILIFEWERTDRLRYLVGATLVMLIGISFHTLTVFGAFIVFFPGLLHADRRKLLQGLAAFIVILIGYELISRWITSLYPPRPAVFGVEKLVELRGFGITQLRWRASIALVGLVTAACLSIIVARQVLTRGAATIAGLMIFCGFALQLLLFYHIGLILLVLGAVVAVRNGRNLAARLGYCGVASLMIAIVQFVVLERTLGLSIWKTLGLMVGLPSVFPYFLLAEFSPVAAILALAAVLLAVWSLSRSVKIPDYLLFALVAAVIPLLMLGFFVWVPEQRYTEFALLPLLLVAFASCQRSASKLLAAAVCILVVNPVSMARVINAGYSIHPDHEGAARFMQTLRLGPKDVVLAEDVIEQTFYLGHVDYWLIGPGVASEFSERSGGRIVDIYTHTPVLFDAAALSALIASPNRGAVYVIGSGEDQENQSGRRYVRGDAIDDYLKSDIFKTVYIGRDRLTRVLKVDAPVSNSQSATDRP